MMDPRKLHTEFGLDSRLEYQGCAHCGAPADTNDHVPSKAFLSEPFPPNLPPAPACNGCNNGFAKDEQYLSCLLDCVLQGSANAASLSRKTQGAFRRSPALAERIAKSKYEDVNGNVMWMAEMDRVENVMLKLARGHILSDLSYIETEAPRMISCMPLIAMSNEQRRGFESAGVGQFLGWPGEIGSRAFLRACGVSGFVTDDGPWITVQPGRYRYAVDNGWVQIVIAEYLACVVEW